MRLHTVRMAEGGPSDPALPLPTATADASNDGTLAALLACGRRGRWKPALELLEQLEARPEPPPPAAYRSALLALRKHERHAEATALLDSMGDGADTHACNEVLHLHRLRADYAAADALWRRMRENAGAAPHAAPDTLSFYHVLHICGELGRWVEATSLLAEMRQSFGDDAAHSGHYLAALRACTRDRRWAEAVVLIRSIPHSTLTADPWLCRLALSAASEGAEPALAATLVDVLGEHATVEQHAARLVASRRAADLPSAREAWAALEASEHEPDDLCYALMVGVLFDAAAAEAAAPPPPSPPPSPLVDEAMSVAARAVSALPAASSPVVLTAALGCAIGAAQSGAARRALQMLHAVDPNCVDAGAQLKVLEVSATAGDWAGLGAEATAARERQTCIGERAHLAVALEHTIGLARDAAAVAKDEAASALDALTRLRASLEATAEEAAAMADASEGADGSQASGEFGEASRARRVAQQRYSRSIALPAEMQAAPLEVVFEDDDLLAISKPIGVPVRARTAHRTPRVRQLA